MNIEKINLQQLSGEQKEIAEIIGLDAYKKLVMEYGGTHLYIAKNDTITRPCRNDEIRQKYNGKNCRQLAREYNLSELTIRNIINKNF